MTYEPKGVEACGILPATTGDPCGKDPNAAGEVIEVKATGESEAWTPMDWYIPCVATGEFGSGRKCAGVCTKNLNGPSMA
mmetsp:Transcript_26454/g.61431  ORF Transcript_26454/g.61431 Transcript_26454/m.61431 type:complete len:80 (+) Transcript_26454:365-604(+)